MALFTVNRYVGNEHNEENTTTDQAGVLLQKLKAEAAKRRQNKQKAKASTELKVKPGEKKHAQDKLEEPNILSDKDKRLRKRRKAEQDDCKSPQEKLKRKRKDGKKKADESDCNPQGNLSVSMETDEQISSNLSSNADDRLQENASDTSASGDETKDSDLLNETTPGASEPQTGPHEIGGYTVLGDFKPKLVEKVKRVLPEWLAKPSVVSADISQDKTPVSQVSGLNQHILDKLTEHGISALFPVQAQIVPAMLSYLRAGYHTAPGGYRPPDICCSAPTGSGKTLAFVLPVVQALMGRVVCQIRALVILPVQDLARQVFSVFQAYCKGTSLKVGLLIGQKTFQNEQQSLVKKRCRGYHSQVDIVIATPGRLVDHINKTDGFDLRHLRFLVIDEADRMMAEIKQDWLTQVEEAVHMTKYGQGLYPDYSRPLPGHITVDSTSKLQMPLQKLLFSATLSQNPEKLQQLKLFQPRLFTSVVTGSRSTPAKAKTKVDLDVTSGTAEPEETEHTEDSTRAEFIGKYTTPVGLSEYFVESFTSEKPLMVLHFLRNLGYRQVLCFTNSVEATHRLFLLVKLTGGVKVKEFSSKLHASKRKRILEQFKAGKIDLLICSDAMARGMDVENVKYVISYDSAPFIKTYIHRVGRTARAGKVGTALTFLQRKEVFHFKKMMKEAGKTNIKEMKVSKSDLEPLVPDFQEALKKLPETLKDERRRTV